MLFSPQILQRPSPTIVAAAATTTWNPSDKNAGYSLSGGNLVATVSGAGGSFISLRAIAGISGSSKKHFEYTITTTGLQLGGLGNVSADLNNLAGNDGNSIGYIYNGSVQVGGPGVASLLSYTVGDTVSVEIDRGANLIWFAKNTGDWNNDPSANPAAGTLGIDISVVTGTLYPMGTSFSNGSVLTANFGATAYTKAASSGFGNF